MTAGLPQNIALKLDRRVPMEAMVLNRLHQLPTARQQDWLRQLVLQGFRNECQLLRAEPTRLEPTTPLRQVPDASGHSVRPAPPPAAFLSTVTAAAQRHFHGLRDVIGERQTEQEPI